jgi:hypothetical protein
LREPGRSGLLLLLGLAALQGRIDRIGFRNLGFGLFEKDSIQMEFKL